MTGNGITVPKEYKHMLRKSSDHNNAMRDADIKLLLESRKNMVLTVDDFVKATGVSSAMLHVKRLMKAGYITRQKLKQPGKRQGWAYKWHDEPLTPKAAIIKNGGTVTTNLNLPPVLMTDVEYEHLRGIYHDWLDTDVLIGGPDFEGARKFLRWIAEQNKIAKQARDKQFNNKGGGDDN